MQYILVVALIEQALNVLNGYLSVIQVFIDITMLVVTIGRDIGLFDGVFGDPLFLLLLSAFTMIICTKIESVLINSDALTLELMQLMIHG